MVNAGNLVDFLTSRTPDQLAGILGRRPEVRWGAPVTDLADLADRLSDPVTLERALRRVPEPCLQLIHGLLALGPCTTRPALLALIEPGDDPDRAAAVDEVLQRLADLAVVWFSGDRVYHDPALEDLFTRPMGIGVPVRVQLARLSRGEIASVAAAWGLPARGAKAELLELVTAVLTDPDRVRAALAGAPTAARRHLDQLALAQAGRTAPPPRVSGLREGENWARHRGLLFGNDYFAPEVPVEVVLAIRNGRERLRFTPRPPDRPTHAVDPPTLRAGAAAAAADATGSLAALIDRLSRTPAAGLKAGGVGSRELVKIGKAIGLDETRVRFDLELLRDLGLLAGAGGSVGITPGAADWRAAEPAERYADLVAVWWTLPIHPSVGRDEDGKVLPAVGRRGIAGSAEVLRGDMLTLLDESGPGRAENGPAALARQLAWHRPLSRVDGESVAAVWQEAHAIGVLVDGAVSAVGRCLLDGDADELVAVAAGLLPPSACAGRFGSDLTVMVAGSPSASVSTLLDACADREGRGAAVVWRFSPASVRRAFDEGWTAGRLTEALTGIAEAGPDQALPQPLTYLIADVARRHGHLVVLPGASCVRASDPALLREVVAHRTLAPLRPHLVTDTVALFQQPPGPVVRALRAAGYLPVPADEQGVVDLHRDVDADPDRAAGPGRPAAGPGVHARERLTATGSSPRAGLAEPEGTFALAAQLLRVPDGNTGVGSPTEAEEYVDLFAPQLTPLERRQLGFAIDHQLPVVITYQTATGGMSNRVISDLQLIGDQLYAWCHLRQDQRVFNAGRIRDVRPVGR